MSTNPPLIPRKLQLGVHPGRTPRGEKRRGGGGGQQPHLQGKRTSCTVCWSAQLQGNTSQLLSQWDPVHPSCCAEVCEHRTTQRGISSRWGPRVRERHGAALQRAPSPAGPTSGAHTHESSLQCMGRGKEMVSVESRGSQTCSLHQRRFCEG